MSGADEWISGLSRRALPSLLRSVSANPTFAPKPGDRVGPYRLVEEMGRGGMGVVYSARDERLARTVALKFLTRPGASAVDRLLAEARHAAALDHPSIVAIHDVGETEEGVAYIVMAYCEGGTLRGALAEGPLPLEESLEIARQVADGLAASHAAGVVHRDVKPSNVMLLPDGRVKVVDFGIATTRDAGAGWSRRAGTAPYMAPERREGQPCGPPSDVWALGCVIHEMLTGARPSPMLSEAVPPDVVDLLTRCLAERAEDRPSAASVARELLALGPSWPGNARESDGNGRRDGRTVSARAHDHTARGRHHLEAGAFEGAARARDEFLRALDVDPLDARAWSGLSDAYEELAYRNLLPPEEAHPRARAAAERALEIDPNLPEAHVSLATVSFDYYRDREKAETLYRRAIELAPDYAKGRQLFAEYLRDVGRFDEALRHADEAIRLDPLSSYYRLVRGIILHMARRHDEALVVLDQLLEAAPEFPIAHMYRAMTLIALERYGEARAALDDADPDGMLPDTVALRIVVLGSQARKKEAGTYYERLESFPSGRALPYHFAIAEMGLGRIDAAVELLEKDVDRRTWFCRIVAVAPLLDPLRQHPGFQELERRVARPTEEPSRRSGG